MQLKASLDSENEDSPLEDESGVENIVWPQSSSLATVDLDGVLESFSLIKAAKHGVGEDERVRSWLWHELE